MKRTVSQEVLQDRFFPEKFAYCTPAILIFASDIGTPVDIYAKLSSTQSYAFMFESVEGDGRLARFSFLGIDPIASIKFEHNHAHIDFRDEKRSMQVPVQNPAHLLKSILYEYQARHKELKDNCSASKRQKLDDFELACNPLPFSGGLAGYLGYGASQYFEDIPQQKKDILQVPEGYYALYDAAVVFDHQYKRIHIVSLRGATHAQEILSQIEQKPRLSPLQLGNMVLPEEAIFSQVETSFSKSDYLESVRKCKDFIEQGEAFQIVLSQRFSTACKSEPLDVYRMLLATNPSPYAYYLKFPEFVYLGSSPETFLQCRKQQLLLRAIAGTRRRGKNAAEDEALTMELQKDEKELAEHHMLVDLGRNDLGRVCQLGTVKPEEIGVINKYTHVMHMSTAINGLLRSDKSCFDAFQSCFPAGTVSGAPKIRAMQLLSQIEPEQRGVYSGAVGYFDLHGDMDAAIAIRSALIKNGAAHVNAGGGIVFDSDPEAEYEESRNKAKSVLQAIKLIEAKQ